MHFEEFQTLSINGNAPSGTGLITRGRKDVFRLEHNMEAKVYFRFRFVGESRCTVTTWSTKITR